MYSTKYKAHVYKCSIYLKIVIILHCQLNWKLVSKSFSHDSCNLIWFHIERQSTFAAHCDESNKKE